MIGKKFGSLLNVGLFFVIGSFSQNAFAEVIPNTIEIPGTVNKFSGACEINATNDTSNFVFSATGIIEADNENFEFKVEKVFQQHEFQNCGEDLENFSAFLRTGSEQKIGLSIFPSHLGKVEKRKCVGHALDARWCYTTMVEGLIPEVKTYSIEIDKVQYPLEKISLD